jgi:hypothetical protein
MPAGPPPGAQNENEEGVESDDDIPMPEGPPPNSAFMGVSSVTFSSA